MVVTSINSSNYDLFASLSQEKWFSQLDYPGRYLLGAIGEDEIGKYAAGVLVFEIRQGNDGNGEIVVCLLQWLYVAPEFRHRGAADAMMQKLFQILAQAQVEAVLCDLSMDSEYNELCAYLEDWGFEFLPINRYELNITLEDVSRHPVFAKAPRPHTVSLRDVPNYLLRDALEKMEHQLYLPDDLYERLPSRDQDLSCIVFEKSSAEGMALVCPDGEGGLELLLMRAFSDVQRNTLDLLSFAGHAAMKKYPPETPVRVICRPGAAAGIINTLFPKAQPLLVRRGVCSVLMDDDELNGLS